MSFRYTCFFILLTVLAACQSSGSPRQDKAIDNLFEREQQNQNNAKYGNKNPDIQVVTDAAQVAAIKHLVQSQERQKAQAANEQLAKKGPVGLYKAGNKMAVPDIIRLLNSRNKERINDLLSELQKNYDDPETYTITEPEIINRILQAVNDPALEKAAIQTAGINNLTGHRQVFENRLRSGKSTDQGRLLYWLSREGNNPVALEYMNTMIRAGKVTTENVSGIITCLEYYGEKGNAATQQLVGDLSLIIYRKNLIPQEEFEELKESAYTSGAAESLLNCLFKYGNEQVIPIANNTLSGKIRTEGPVLALIRLQGPQHLGKVYAFLRDPNTYYDGLDIVAGLDKKYLDDQLLKEVLVQFTKQEDKNDRLVERMTRSFIEMNQVKYLQKISSYIPDKQLVGQFQKAYKLFYYSTDTVIADLVKFGLFDQSPAAAVIEKAKKEADRDVRGFIYSLLNSCKRYLAFDAEVGMVPVDYPSLLHNFAGISDGLLKDLGAAMETRDNGDQTFKYRVSVVYKNKGYVMQPPDMGDWYDIMSVNALVGKVMEQTGSPKRFVNIETGDQTVQYIFGEPAKVQALQQKYGL
jgi:hypothetical protein